jgi:hypothetical protein
MTAQLSTEPAADSPTQRPTDFRFDDALERASVKKLRALITKVFGFDPVPPPDVVELFSQDMWTGDPVAETFLAEVFAGREGRINGRKLLDQAIDHGIDSVPNAPASMQALFEEFETIPDWVNPKLVEQGAAIWRRWGTDLFGVAGAGTLEMYTESAIAIPLSLAGGYAGDNALRRFLETVKFWLDVSEPGALLNLGTEGRGTALRVRVMHVSVRARVAGHPEWDAERWGLPISQAYMEMTLLGGSIGPALAMWQFGYQTTGSEIRALLHFQRFMGHLLGVHPRWYPETVRESIQLLFVAMVARSHTAGPHGAELIESFPRAFEPRGGGSLRQRARANFEHRLICGYVSMMLAPSTIRRHDLPHIRRWMILPLLRFPLISLRELVRRFVPGMNAVIERRSRRRAEAWYELQMNGRQAAFDASSELRR